MIFIISKIISFFIDPMVWIVGLLIFARFTHMRIWKKRCYTAAVVFFLFFSNPWILNNIWNAYQWKPVELKDVPTSDVGILLGGLSGYDEEWKMGFFGQTSDRFIQTNRLYDAGKIRNILVTGGNAIFVKEQSYSEADFLAKNFKELQVPAIHILTETKAKNTLQNARFSQLIMDSLHLQGPAILITSAIHMPRAVRVFKKAGVEVVPFPSNFQVTQSGTKFSWGSIMPSPAALLNWSSLLREWVGLIQLALVG